MTKTYTSTEVATEFGVTTRTMRHYEEQGLLSPRPVAAQDGDVCAAANQSAGHLAAEHAGAAGHQNRASGEIIHPR